ncbi:MAG TPA: threonine synthase [Spirochaetales bacterium]|nr:threonine synthase [Spirochaetales bacterium]
MKYISTRDQSTNPETVSFKEAIFRGLAPDGGLYYPREQPDLTEIFKSFNPATSYKEVVLGLCNTLFSGELSEESVRRIVEKAYSFEPKLKSLGHGLHLLELFHGPSCAFKDFGAFFLAAAMDEFLKGSRRKALVLVATSGDTGSAVARAFLGRSNIEVVILYPSGRVSPLQEKQLTTLGGNITTLEVECSFDDCQRLVKKAFMDRELQERLNLTSANSINLGRLIPQSFYYFYALSRFENPQAGEYWFSVPSGNFGNLTAGLYAQQWGLPVRGFIAATNINDVVPQYLESGIYNPHPSFHTLSNAMDVGDPSNFERLMTLFNQDLSAMRRMLRGEKITDAETLKTIREVSRDYGFLIDPHTAVGWLAARRLQQQKLARGAEIIVLSTANAGKFSETVSEATGMEPDLPEALKSVLDLPKQAVQLGNTPNELFDFLLKQFG